MILRIDELDDLCVKRGLCWSIGRSRISECECRVYSSNQMLYANRGVSKCKTCGHIQYDSGSKIIGRGNFEDAIDDMISLLQSDLSTSAILGVK